MFRGVSKNGNKWQVVFICNKKKIYLGGFDSEVVAAKKYDEIAIRANGLKAKTNFKYTKYEL